MTAARATLADYEAQRAAYKRTARKLDERLVRTLVEAPSEGLTSGGTSSPIVALARGMAAWVATTQLSLNVEYTSSKSGGEDIDDLLLSDPENFRRQSNYSAKNSATLAAVIDDLGADPSYTRWGNQWGKDLAIDGVAGPYSDAAKVEGLAYQWYANIQGDMLAAILRDPPTVPTNDIQKD